jgi:hypothetical protein
MERSWSAEPRLTPEALEFVRFCYRRRRVGWPELYDEMCLVAGRRIYQDMGQAELAEHGIGFALFEMPALATLVARVIEEEDPARAARARRPLPRPKTHELDDASAPGLAKEAQAAIA